MFSDESPFSVVREVQMHCPNSVSRYGSKFTIKTVKPLESVMMWKQGQGRTVLSSQ